ncbi:MAG TPA: hypothetical protein VGF56_07800 [Rhizomicrobium sp.]
MSVAYGGVCTSALAFDGVLRNFDFQRSDRWGWATAISLIFAYYGYRVSQDAIIDKAYDGMFDLSGDYVQNARQLNRPWVDENGHAFTSLLKPLFAVTPYAQNTAQAEMVAALDRGQPVLLCDNRHAMVLTSLSYASAAAAPEIRRALVVDPWPDNDRIHELDTAQLTAPPAGKLNFAAVVQVYASGKEAAR